MVVGQADQAASPRTTGIGLSVAKYEGTSHVRSGFALNEPALDRWMDSHVAGYAGPMTITQFNGGQSNPTYRLETAGGCYVLRRKPPGSLARGAHAIEREVQVMRALGTTGFPVPHVHALCEDATVLGSPFYVMDMVEGRVIWDATFPGMSRADRAACFDAMNATIAQLHGINPAAVGLADFGRPGRYVERQVARWARQYRDDDLAGQNEDMDAVIDWLEVNMPTNDEEAIVHGDFRCDNMIFHPVEPRVLAVLDWELSTIGDPLADFAYHAMMYRMPADIVAGLLGADVTRLGLPAESAYVQAYCLRTGREGIPHYPFYIVFNFFRLAAIFHGIKGRVLRNTAVSSDAAERARAFPRLARLAREQIDKIG